MKYLAINLTKYVKDLYEENYQTAVNDKEELYKWRDIPCSWIGRLNMIKISVLAHLIYGFNLPMEQKQSLQQTMLSLSGLLHSV